MIGISAISCIVVWAAVRFLKTSSPPIKIIKFQELGFFANAQEIGGLIGNNVNRLRKLSQVKNSAYYRDEKYLQALKEINDAEKWGLEYDGKGLLVASEQTIESILKYLNNDRLSSKINNEEFAVDVKHKLGA